MTESNPTEGKTTTKTRAMTPEHKEALAEGRKHGKIVADYLQALEVFKPKRGRKATPENIRERILKVDARIPEAHGTERLSLIQLKMDLEAQLQRTEVNHDITELQKEFVQVAKPFAERKGLTYNAFREAGVPANVLKEAGLDRKVA